MARTRGARDKKKRKSRLGNYIVPVALALGAGALYLKNKRADNLFKQKVSKGIDSTVSSIKSKYNTESAEKLGNALVDEFIPGAKEIRYKSQDLKAWERAQKIKSKSHKIDNRRMLLQDTITTHNKSKKLEKSLKAEYISQIKKYRNREFDDFWTKDARRKNVLWERELWRQERQGLQNVKSTLKRKSDELRQAGFSRFCITTGFINLGDLNGKN